METVTHVCKNDWIRFQVPDGRVLEGFVQEISADGARLRVGKGPDSPENEWHDMHTLIILKTQTLGAPV